MRDAGEYAQTELPFVKGSATSLRAAELAEEEGLPALQRARLMVAYEIGGLAGLTDEEAQHISGLDGNSQRPRRGELRARGLIEPCGKKKTRSGREAVAWRLASLTVR